MQENRTSGSVRGAPGNRRSYRESRSKMMSEYPCELKSYFTRAFWFCQCGHKRSLHYVA